MNILTFPSPLLTRRTRLVSFEKPDEATVFEQYSEKDVEAMKEELARTPNGIALAANQVGLRCRLFVVEPTWAKAAGLPEVVVNPTWSAMNDETTDEAEGCLSFPGMRLKIERFANLDCSFDTPDGLHHHLILNDFAARVFQHECEHLEGETFLENLPRVERYRIIGNLRKRKGL